MKKTYIAAVIVLLLLFSLWSGLKARADLSYGQSLAEQRTELEKQLQEIEREIQADQQALVKVQSQKNTLANKIKELKIKQSALILKIQQASLNIDRTVVQLSQTQYQIDQYQNEIKSSRDRLGQIINDLWREKQSSFFDILFTARSFSDFYNQLHNLETLIADLNNVIRVLQKQEADLHSSEELLVAQNEEQRNYYSLVSLQKSELTQNISDQNDLLKQTKGKETSYQNLIKANKAQAAAIRSRIYNLIGATTQINFGQAVDIANWASGQTGVRPAFLLAILTQESNLGRNVGTCNRAGDPATKSWKVVMKPDRDQTPFLQITKELDLNPDTTPISCPMKDKNGHQVGWGGAMGPAQFIPSTWMGYRAKITAITGKTANPWDIRDAFLAAAIKLKADGGGSQSGEWTAAMRYFSGSTNPAYSFYGDNVVATAAKYQADIDQLNAK